MMALGLSAMDLSLGDEFRFEATITKKDGAIFSSKNTGSNLISQTPFASLFRVAAKVK